MLVAATSKKKLEHLDPKIVVKGRFSGEPSWGGSDETSDQRHSG